ncbi:uncharacterized protein LOC108098618 isoform X2 [Drosophila ficusphila]|uniref:uncharacterized protein LOC108098618 isoform X2 n=1 Tax=Drosophila ficusphila TaxID=30025 RepID=UPI0007E8A0C8|nr:uncharacterized protein LOC108098618 isoform X2 [Drosophila ficusphila]
MNRTALSTGSSSRKLPALLFGLLLCLLLLAQTAQTTQTARTSSEDESDLAVIPPDADNVEIHQVRIVDGVLQEDHPVIMYKEDFVSEDYDPTKNETNPGRHKKHRRTHHHRAEPQQESEDDKILFDILPDKPIVLSDDLKALPKSNVEAAQLAEPIKEPLKEEWLGKYPKKVHSRQRRQAQNAYEPVYEYYRENPKLNYLSFLIYKRPIAPGKAPPKLQPVNQSNNIFRQDTVPQPDFVGNRDDFNSIIHNSDPNIADFSIYTSTTKRPPFVIMESEPVTRKPIGSNSWGNGLNGWGADLVPLAGFSPPGLASAPPTRRPPSSSRIDSLQFPQELGYQEGSQCQRASKYCCSQKSIGSQYDCFHHYGCPESISAVISSCS